MNANVVSLNKVWFEPWSQKGAPELEYGEFQFHVCLHVSRASDEENAPCLIGASFIDATGRQWELLNSAEKGCVLVNASGESVVAFASSNLMDEPQCLIEHSTFSIRLISGRTESAYSFDIYHDGALGDLVWDSVVKKCEVCDAR